MSELMNHGYSRIITVTIPEYHERRSITTMTTVITEPRRRPAPGRPPAFDRNAVLEAAISDFRKRIEKGIGEGVLRPETDAQGLARYVGAMIQGMSIQARDGARKSELLRIARLASNEIRRHRQGELR